MRLGLGTVQFGVPYGISNRHGIVTPVEVASILRRARSAGVEMLDTAPAYGVSQKVLGDSGASSLGFKLVTKSPVDGAVESWRPNLESSLAELKIKSAHGWLAHRAGDLLGSHARQVREIMLRAKADGLISRIGASVYSLEEVEALYAPSGNDRVFDLIQLPASIFDRRMIKSGWLKRLKEMDVEIHVRSAFLQGLLFMGVKDLPPALFEARRALVKIEALSVELGVRRSALALGYLKSLGLVDVVLCGVTSVDELEQLIQDQAWESPHGFVWDEFEITDEAILNPSKWGKSA